MSLDPEMPPHEPPDPQDDALREAFQSQKRHDARRVPEFAAVLARTSARPAWTRWVAPVSALALAACVLLGLQLGRRSDSAPAMSVGPAPAVTAAPAVTSEPPAPVPTAAARALSAKRELGLTKQQLDALGKLAAAAQPDQAAQVERLLTRAQRARWRTVYDAGAP